MGSFAGKFGGAAQVFAERFAAHLFGVVLGEAFAQGERLGAAAQSLGKAGRKREEDRVDIGEAEVGLQQGVRHQREQLVRKIFKSRAADAAQQQAGLPAELHEDADGEQPREIGAQGLVPLREVPHDQGEVSRKQQDRHISVVSAGRPLDDDGFAPTEGRRDHGRAQPPKQDERRPLGQPFVLRDPKPDPDEVGKAVAHRHPEQHPEQAGVFRDAARVEYEVEQAVIDGEVHQPEKQPHQHGHVFLFPKQQPRQHEQECDVQPDVQRVKLPPRDDLFHSGPSFVIFVMEKHDITIIRRRGAPVNRPSAVL